MKKILLLLFSFISISVFSQQYANDVYYINVDSIQFAGSGNGQTYRYDSTRHPMIQDSITEWVTITQLKDTIVTIQSEIDDTASNLRTDLLRKDALQDSLRPTLTLDTLIADSIYSTYAEIDTASITLFNNNPSLRDDHDSLMQHNLVDAEWVEKYVAANVNLGARYYLLDAADIAVATYKQTSLTPSELTTASVNTSVDAETNTLIEEWISPSGLAFDSLIAGIYTLHIHAQKTAGNRSVRLYWDFYERENDGTEHLISTSNLSSLVTSKDEFQISTVLSTSYGTAASNSRLVGKIYMQTTGGSQNTTTYIYYQGEEASNWLTPLSEEYFTNNYLKLADFYDSLLNRDFIDSTETIDSIRAIINDSLLAVHDSISALYDTAAVHLDTLQEHNTRINTNLTNINNLIADTSGYIHSSDTSDFAGSIIDRTLVSVGDSNFVTDAQLIDSLALKADIADTSLFELIGNIISPKTDGRKFQADTGYFDNIGVGIATPIFALNIVGIDNNSSSVYQQRNSNNTYGVTHSYIKGRAGGAVAQIGDYSGGGSFGLKDVGGNPHIYAGIFGQIINNANGAEYGDILFGTAPSGSNLDFNTVGTEKMRLKYNGKLGLGTISPLAKLHIESASATTTPTISSLITNSNATVGNYATQAYGMDATDEDFSLITGGKIENRTGGSERIAFIVNPLKAGSYANTSFYTSQDSTVFSINGTRKMWLTSLGLHLKDTLFIGSNTLKLYITADSGYYDASSHIFNIDGDEKMRIAENGYVGIGVNNPSNIFHLYESDRDASMRIQNEDNSWSFGIYDYDDNNSPDFYFNGIGASVDALVIKGNTGFIGIGTTTPSEKLEVNGNVLINDSLKIGSVSLHEDGNDLIVTLPAATDTFEINGNIKATNSQFDQIIFTNRDSINDGGSYTLDLSGSNLFVLTPDEITVLDYSNAEIGTYLIEIIQGGTGYAVTLAADKWRATEGTQPTITATASSHTLLSCYYNGWKMIVTSIDDLQDL